MRIQLRLALVVVALALGACTSTTAPAAKPAGEATTPAAPATPKTAPATGQGQLDVVATYSILGHLVQQVAQDKVTVHTLVGPGQDTHTFEPSPGDSATLAKAAVVFENGLGFDAWVDELYAAAGAKARRVVVTDGLQNLIAAGEHDEHDADEQEGDHADAQEDEHGDEHGEFDPHVWHDVNNTRHMVTTIRDALSEADPTNAAAYQANADRYLTELQALDAWIVEQVDAVPEARRKLVTSHDTFSYFARRYGFEVIGTALGSATTEGAEPSAAAFARLVQEIKAAGVPAIFAENISNTRLMERLAQEAGVKLAPELYTDALSKAGEPGETYVKMMRHNVTTITTALNQ